MIYIASPYSHKSAEVRHSRYEAALHYASILMAQGVTCFSPVVYGYIFNIRGLASGDYLTWKDFNDRMLLSSTAMHVIKLDGWEESAGIKYELNFAESNGIPVIFFEPRHA